MNRHQVRNALQVLDPQGVAERGKAIGKSRSRKEFYIQGPNRVLSIDGHDKLSRFGFEIYGAIDAYSRYIVWCYIGISNRTAVSVNKQYLRFVRNTMHIPQVIRSDKGNILFYFSFIKSSCKLILKNIILKFVTIYRYRNSFTC